MSLALNQILDGNLCPKNVQAEVREVVQELDTYRRTGKETNRTAELSAAAQRRASVQVVKKPNPQTGQEEKPIVVPKEQINLSAGPPAGWSMSGETE